MMQLDVRSRTKKLRLHPKTSRLRNPGEHKDELEIAA